MVEMKSTVPHLCTRRSDVARPVVEEQGKKLAVHVLQYAIIDDVLALVDILTHHILQHGGLLFLSYLSMCNVWMLRHSVPHVG